jgi:hypothetical protein
VTIRQKGLGRLHKDSVLAQPPLLFRCQPGRSGVKGLIGGKAYCGGIYKLRAVQAEVLDSGLLFTLLNLPFVRRQMRNKQFTRDVIDTLGKRLAEVVLPIPKDPAIKKAIACHVAGLISERSALRHGLSLLIKSMYSRKGPEKQRSEEASGIF